jgi:hypothetical protein
MRLVVALVGVVEGLCELHYKAGAVNDSLPTAMNA